MVEVCDNAVATMPPAPGLGCIHQLPPPTPPKLVREFTGVFNAVQGDLRSIGHLVAEVLKDCGWNEVNRDAVLVEDKSGHGGSKTYKVTGPGMEPPVVAVHARSLSSVADPIWERRMEAAAVQLARYEVAPRRLAQGVDWFIEAWEGVHIGELQLACELTDGNTSVQELARLMAKIHKIPTEWFEVFREQLGIVKFGLQGAPQGSCIWWPACRVEEWMTKMSDEHLLRLIAVELKPRSSAGARIVTVHGDLHRENVIRTEGECLKAIDLEFTHATHAVADIAYTMDAVCDTEAKRRGFAEAYLQAMGDEFDAAAVDCLVLDALSYSALNQFGGILWQELDKLKDAPDHSFDVYSKYTAVLEEAFASSDICHDIIRNGFMSCAACVELSAESKRLEYAALQPQLSNVHEDLSLAPLVALSVNPCIEHWPLNVLAPQLTFTCWLILAEHQSELPAEIMEDYSLTICAAECTNGLGDFDISWHQRGIVFMLNGNRLAEKKKNKDALPFLQRGLANATWQHIAVRYDSTAAVADLFVNGELAESHSFSVAFPVRLTTVSIGEFRENKHVHRYLVDSSRFPQGQLRDAKLYARALSAEEVQEAYAAHCTEGTGSPFPVPEVVQQSSMTGENQFPGLGCNQVPAHDDPELAAALAMSLAASSGAGFEVGVECGLEVPMQEHQQQMLNEVTAMGFDEASARNALEATAWTSVEGAIAVLFG